MLTVHADPDSLNITQSGTVTGRINLADDERSFPDDTWNDAPVVLLGWWIEELTRLLSGQVSTAHCRFLDGPFSFDVTRHGNELVLRCRRSQLGEQVILSARVPLDAFMHRLVASASRVVAVCEGRGWKSADLTLLGDLVKAGRVDPGAAL